MHGIQTLAKLNREADEAHRIVAAHNVGIRVAPGVTAEKVEQRADPHQTIDRILKGARG